MAVQPAILARGPWRPGDLEVTWRPAPFELPASVTDAVDAKLAELAARGSPAHDGLSARMRSFEVRDGRLALECEPVRWGVRLLTDDALQSLSALCIVRAADGRWLAGRRSLWLATWAGRWALGAAGAVEVGENPADTLVRELREEWSVAPERLTVEALARGPNGGVMVVGMAWLAPAAVVTPEAEHDEFAWWPAPFSGWPAHADEPLRRIAELVSANG